MSCCLLGCRGDLPAWDGPYFEAPSHGVIGADRISSSTRSPSAWPVACLSRTFEERLVLSSVYRVGYVHFDWVNRAHYSDAVVTHVSIAIRRTTMLGRLVPSDYHAFSVVI